MNRRGPPCNEVTRKRKCVAQRNRSEEHTSELQSPCNLVCRLLLEKKKTKAILCSRISQHKQRFNLLTYISSMIAHNLHRHHLLATFPASESRALCTHLETLSRTTR